MRNFRSFLNQAFCILRFPIVVLFVNIALEARGIYYTLPWIDMPMHFLGGVSIAVAGISFLALLQKHALTNALPFPVWVFLIISFVGLAAVFWELWEFSIDLVFKKNLQGDLSDTMIDMFFGLLGGFTASIAWFCFRKEDHS